MSEAPRSQSSRSSLRRGLVLLGVLVLVYAAYEGVRYGVRRHVDGLIEASVGKSIDFELRDREGRPVRASDLRGKVVVLNFFRSKCSRCRLEAPVIRELAQNVDPEQVRVLGVMMDEVEGYDPRETRQTLEAFAYEHPVLMADADFVDTFHGAGWANVTPITYVLGPDGSVRQSLRGHQTLGSLQDAIAAAR